MMKRLFSRYVLCHDTGFDILLSRPVSQEVEVGDNLLEIPLPDTLTATVQGITLKNSQLQKSLAEEWF
ncbi:hypothetical protein [Lacrimispora sp.]|uniref:hypothetical protein n=1 Tax=Lacrimispora sp. TaxID=2719234 RepID=UPI0034600D6F